MKEQTMIVLNPVGLHSHMATFFTQTANSFESSIWLEKGSRRVNAKSLLGVLSLCVVGSDIVSIIANGPDEDRAISAFSEFMNADFSSSEDFEEWIVKFVMDH